jgi:hypothetical protein
MATNVCVPIYEPGGRVTGRPTADVTGKRFVKLSGPKNPASLGLAPTGAGGNILIAPAGAGDEPVGVAEADCAASADATGKVTGKQSSVVTVLCMNMVVPIEAAVQLTAGDWVKVGAQGKADKAADKATACGRSWSTTPPGQDAVIKLGTSL